MDRRILYVLGAAALLSSCAKVEMTDGGKALDPNQIAFSVRSGLQTQPGTRSGPEEEQPAMLLGGQGEDTLYLHPSVVVNDRGFGMPATRGVPVTKDNISSFTVTAKVHGSETLYMNEVEVTRQGNSDVWTTSDGKHFWPDEQTSLDFYAYSNLTETDNPDSPVVSGLTCNGGQLGFSYIVPNGTEGSDAERQPDILFALASANRSQTQDGDGTVILNFQHALAGVQFRAKNIAGGTIQSITLKNLYGQGDCTYTLSGETTDSGARKNGTFEWSNLGGESKTRMDFVQKMSVEVKESSTLSDGTLQDVTTGANNEMTFMMIPQSTEGVEVEIELKLKGDHDQETYIVSGKLSGPDPSSPITWEAGNLYIYDISTDSINWTYVFEVTPSITLPLGQTSATYIVTSYRYRTQLGDSEANREPVPWTASCVSANETDSETGRGPVEPASVVTEFQDKGDGDVSESGEECGLVLKRGTLHTTWDGDEKLQNAEPKGSEDSPYDLSTHDWSGNNINETTANCYIVNAPGTYMLPLVYGNAIKDGQPNPAAYSNSSFKDYMDRPISGPYIDNPHDCCLVWSDGFYMFENVHLSNDKKYLIFSINPDFLQQANAILAVRDAQQKIMWSWHIWVTERDVDSTTHTITDYFNQNNTFELMSCNLGWVDGKMVYYNQRDLAYQFTQAGSGKTAPMTVLQEGETFDYKDVGSTYYQWGRKDPLVAMRNWKNVGFNDYRLHETGHSDYVYKYEEKNVTIGESIQHPNVYYVRGTTSGAANWCSSNIPSLWDTGGRETSEPENVISSTKTIYDPSPRGFKVPIPRAFAVFVNGSHGDGGQGGVGSFNGVLNGEQVLNGDVKNQYKVWTKPNGQGSQIPFTATGQRADKAGLPVYMEGDNAGELGGLWSMYGVYYWTCVAFNNITGYSFVVRHDQPDTNPKAVRANSYRFNGTKTMARPVRPIKE